jgi:hypothetical protein
MLLSIFLSIVELVRVSLLHRVLQRSEALTCNHDLFAARPRFLLARRHCHPEPPSKGRRKEEGGEGSFSATTEYYESRIAFISFKLIKSKKLNT